MLAAKETVVTIERSTRDPLSDAEARALLGDVDTVLLVRGTALRELPARSVKPADLRGPTGKIRAPLVRVGRTLLAGFRLEALERLLAEAVENTAQPSRPSASRRKA